MRFSKSFNLSVCGLPVKLFLIVIVCSLLVCCVGERVETTSTPQNLISVSKTAININSASALELEKLPHVGEKIAQRIVEHREKFGRFRRAENLLLVDGISDGRFREIRSFVKVE